MKVDPDTLNVFGAKSEAMEGLLKRFGLTAVSVQPDHDDGQYQVVVITPYPLNFQTLNEAQNALRRDLQVPVFLESFNPNHAVARTRIEIATNGAFHLQVVRTLYQHRLFRPRFDTPQDTLVAIVTVGEPFEQERIAAAQRALNAMATFDIQIRPRQTPEND